MYSYFAVNKRRLGLQEAKQAYESFPSIDTLKDVSEAYIMNGKYEKSIELLKNTIKFNDDLSIFSHAQYAFRTGHWGEALAHYQSYKFDPTNEPEFYDLLQASIIAELAESEWRPEWSMDKYANKPWEKALLSFWKGEKSAQDLIPLATDVCKQLEAHTYIGFKYMQQNDINKAKFHLVSATALGIPLFVEDGLATHLLNNINH
jgi:tetratricopeptide (TPR) repeat protein